MVCADPTDHGHGGRLLIARGSSRPFAPTVQRKARTHSHSENCVYGMVNAMTH